MRAARGHAEEGPGNGEDQRDGDDGLDLERHSAHTTEATHLRPLRKGDPMPGRHRIAGPPAPSDYRALSSSVMSETEPLASPNSMLVLGLTNSGLSMPA